MLLHERFAFFIGLGPIELEEAVIARRFRLRTSTTAADKRYSCQVNDFSEAKGIGRKEHAKRLRKGALTASSLGD